MAAYFARWLVGGVITLFLAGLLLYSLVLYTPGSVYSWLDELRNPKGGDPVRDISHILNQWDTYLSIDKPWPQNYTMWLFNPHNIVQVVLDEKNDHMVAHWGIDVTLGDLRLVGSGILTGDLGISFRIERGRPIIDIFGPGFGEFMLLLPLTILTATTLVLVQRWRRPRLDWLSGGPHVSVLVDEYRQRLALSRL